eukprot:scaffold581_cov263-Pinguiococcus_pyrenoidosus.AAC.13
MLATAARYHSTAIKMRRCVPKISQLFSTVSDALSEKQIAAAAREAQAAISAVDGAEATRALATVGAAISSAADCAPEVLAAVGLALAGVAEHLPYISIAAGALGQCRTNAHELLPVPSPHAPPRPTRSDGPHLSDVQGRRQERCNGAAVVVFCQRLASSGGRPCRAIGCSVHGKTRS